MQDTFVLPPNPMRRSPPGTAPGTLISHPNAVLPKVQIIEYGPDHCSENMLSNLDDLKSIPDAGVVTWINVEGLADIEFIGRLGDLLGLHRLALEDVVNTHQRPKVEEYDDHIFIVTQMPGSSERFESEQITLFLGRGVVLTFQERPGDCWGLVRDRIKRNRGRIREANADYLAYALLDAVVDAFFPVLERYGERLESLETQVLEKAEPDVVVNIHQLKRDMLAIRRAIWPQRELFNALIREKSPLVDDQTQVYMRDCYDHTVHLMDMIETYREIASGLIDVYLSSVSTRMNEVMKVLTIISTIFIPLGFVASLYGMNFDRAVSPWNMPELGWRYGYPMVIGAMTMVALSLIGFFWRKGWIGRAKRRE